MPARIPEREPLGDPFMGVVLQVGQEYALAREPVPGTRVIAEGEFVVRYAVPLLGKTQLSIVPGLVIMDYGDILTGEDAWTFITRRSHLYPRAEVAGYRSDGADDMVFIRQLDLAQPVRALVYAEASATRPLANVSAVLGVDAEALPPHLRDTVPVYPTLDAWQTERPT